MKLILTELDGCFIIEPTIFHDSRGWFFESFNEERFNQLSNLNIRFVQDNQSFSTKGVLRGLHYQRGMYQQAKLIQVLSGTILDVVVDLRIDSPTYRKSISVELDSITRNSLFVPKGFAHGFVVLSEQALIHYKCDNYYFKDAEGGIIYNDESLNINWRFDKEELIVSEKDNLLPRIENSLSICEF
ncbi:MAG: dTDP-4-dehydrorhamnose 3,5-epimerase [Flavobacteriaceae bacterium]|jgi:dTDP-4-dehydrorhamnose 3,5-epimerase|nr:dTDP-4-dehydrorhamnose 3,5-epimerase [Flavobacteriaceae bacterium]